MRQLIVILMIGSLVLTTVATADDADDVKAAQLALIAALNEGDVEIIAQYLLSEHSRFPAEGLLVEGFTKEDLKAAFNAGLKLAITARHLDVKIYGNTAIATGYIEGSITLPGGIFEEIRQRFTEVWIKQGDNWKRVHIHSSPLT